MKKLHFWLAWILLLLFFSFFILLYLPFVCELTCEQQSCSSSSPPSCASIYGNNNHNNNGLHALFADSTLSLDQFVVTDGLITNCSSPTTRLPPFCTIWFLHLIFFVNQYWRTIFFDILIINKLILSMFLMLVLCWSVFLFCACFSLITRVYFIDYFSGFSEK
jgi:hypothetical protein